MKRSRSGSVLMEYVVLSCLVGVVLLEFVHVLFYNPVDGFRPALGIPFVQRQQRSLSALALPIP